MPSGATTLLGAEPGDRHRGLGGVITILVSGRRALRQRNFVERASSSSWCGPRPCSSWPTAVFLMTGHASGLSWQAAGTGVCLVAGMSDAWVLLIEILRQTKGRYRCSAGEATSAPGPWDYFMAATMVSNTTNATNM